MENRVLEKFHAGDKSLGTFTHLLSTPAIEALAYTGLDYVIIDMEHSPIAAEHAAELVGVASGAGLPPSVRVDASQPHKEKKMLDVGAAGLIVPGVETVDEVKKLVEYAKFAPLGGRGYCPSRDGGWGMAECYAEGMGGYMERANHNTLLLPQCETMGCLENIDEILGMDGVDGIFIGPFDLSIALGIPGDFANERHINAVAHVLDVCKKHGKLSVMFCGSAEAANGYFKQGFDSVTVSLDISVMADAFVDVVKKSLA